MTAHQPTKIPEGKRCLDCSGLLILDSNFETYALRKKHWICNPCKNIRIKSSKAYTDKRVTGITRIHGRTQLHRRLVKKYHDVLNGAARRCLEFCISRDDFIEITSKNCAYCGSPSTLEATNGLDRIDSDVGYTLSNVAPCCRFCNVGKSILTAQEYIEHCGRVHAFNHT